jgi:hypothetical protein
MTKKQDDQKSHQVRANERRPVRKTVWDDAEIVVDIKHTKRGTALDDLLRTQQTRVLLSAYRDETPQASAGRRKRL